MLLSDSLYLKYALINLESKKAFFDSIKCKSRTYEIENRKIAKTFNERKKGNGFVFKWGTSPKPPTNFYSLQCATGLHTFQHITNHKNWKI